MLSCEQYEHLLARTGHSAPHLDELATTNKINITHGDPRPPTMNVTITGPELEKYLLFYFIGYMLTMLLKRMSKQANNERRRLIAQHIRAGHTDPLRTCLHPDCQPLRHL